MSIAFCRECDHIVEGSTRMDTDEHGVEYEYCISCGQEVSNLPEDDPREDR